MKNSLVFFGHQEEKVSLENILSKTKLYHILLRLFISSLFKNQISHERQQDKINRKIMGSNGMKRDLFR